MIWTHLPIARECLIFPPDIPLLFAFSLCLPPNVPPPISPVSICQDLGALLTPSPPSPFPLFRMIFYFSCFPLSTDCALSFTFPPLNWVMFCNPVKSFFYAQEPRLSWISLVYFYFFDLTILPVGLMTTPKQTVTWSAETFPSPYLGVSSDTPFPPFVPNLLHCVLSENQFRVCFSFFLFFIFPPCRSFLLFFCPQVGLLRSPIAQCFLFVDLFLA